MLVKGDPPRRDAMCPRCFSLERHRLLWLFLTGEAGGPDRLAIPQRVLHMAPEPALRARLRGRKGWDYRTADRAAGRADEAFDLTAIPHPDDRFDLILCCHVLEHVEDDRAALRELHRVTAPGGSLLVQVPLGEGPTQEDARIDTPELRRRFFGQADHLRLYGLDLAERMRRAGYEVAVERPFDAVPEPQRSRCRLAPDGEAGEPVFVARKPPRVAGS